MLETVLFWIFVPEGLIFFIALCLLIVSYLNRKLPALQTLLDLVIIDTVYIAILTNIFGQLPYLLHFAGIRLNSYLPHLFIAIFRCCLTSFCNLTQIALIVKSILLFKSQWLDGLVDQEVLGGIRLGVMVLTLVMFVIDLIPFVQTENRMNHGLALMTGEEHTR